MTLGPCLGGGTAPPEATQLPALIERFDSMARLLLACRWLLAAGFAFAASAQAQSDFTPEDIEACPAPAGIVDPEFHSAGRRMVFFDRQNRVKVTSLRSDGTLGAGGCAGTVIDTGATLSIPGFPLLNGAEWATSQRGIELYYTRLDESGRPAIARAYENGGSWYTQVLDASTDRGLPIPTMNPDDPQARILYARSGDDGGYELMWRETTDATTERGFAALVRQASGGAPRWVRGQRAITTAQLDAQGVPQAARIDIDTGAVEQLTFDAGAKDEVWMWAAPEFGGAWVFATVVDGSELRIYRQEGAAWTIIRSLAASAFSSHPGIYSPEPTIVNGRSYLAMQLSAQKYGPADIWVASIDPAQPLLRQVSDPAKPMKVRSEPEWVLTPQGAFVFYTQNEGRDRASLRRARTGL